MIGLAQPASPFRFALDVALGAVGASRLIVAYAVRFLDWLLEMNSTRVESDPNERVLESRRSLEAEVRVLLQEVRTSAEQALVRGKSTQAAGARAVEQELARIPLLERALRELAPSSTADAASADTAGRASD